MRAMARLIRMDQHRAHHAGGVDARTTRRVEAAVAAFREQLDAGYYAVVSAGRGARRAGARAAARRRAGDPAPPDRRRLSGRSVLPETAAVYWRPRLDARAPAAAASGCWTATTVAHTVPFLSRPALLMALEPLSFPVAGDRASRTPGGSRRSTPTRGANVRARRARGPTRRPERTALGLLGDLVGHDARELHARTGLVLERGAPRRLARGGGRRAARPPRRPARGLLVREGPTRRPALRRPHRAPAAGAARGRGGLRDGRQPRLQRRGAGACGGACRPRCGRRSTRRGVSRSWAWRARSAAGARPRGPRAAGGRGGSGAQARRRAPCAERRARAPAASWRRRGRSSSEHDRAPGARFVWTEDPNLRAPDSTSGRSAHDSLTRAVCTLPDTMENSATPLGKRVIASGHHPRGRGARHQAGDLGCLRPRSRCCSRSR